MDHFVFTAETKDIVIRRINDRLETWNPEKPCEVIVKLYRKTRTNEQNRALWGLAYKLLSEHTGYRAEEIHEYLCGQFFGWEQTELFGKPRHRPRRTTTTNEQGERDVLETKDFAEFFDFIQQFAAEILGLHIPDPDPNWRTNQEQAA